MADDIDRAAERTAELLDDALAAHRRRVAKQSAVAEGDECRDCGDEIPLARRMAVLESGRCVYCQGRHEARGR